VLTRERIAHVCHRVAAWPLRGVDAEAEPGRSLPDLVSRSIRRLNRTARRLGRRPNTDRELSHLVNFFAGVYERAQGSGRSLLEISRRPLEALGVSTEELYGLHFDAGELHRLRTRIEPMGSAEAIRLSWHLVRTCWPCKRPRIDRFMAGVDGSAHPDAEPLLRVALAYRRGNDPRVPVRRVLDLTLDRSEPESVLDRVFRTGLRIVPAAAEQLRGNDLADLLAWFHLAVARAYTRSAEATPPGSKVRFETLQHSWEETELGVCWTNLGSWRDTELRSRGFESYAEAFRLAGVQVRALEALRQAVRVLGNRGSLPSPRELNLLVRLAQWQEERDSDEAYRVFLECQRLIERRRIGEWLRREVEAGLVRTEPDSVKLALMGVSGAPAPPPSRPSPGLIEPGQATAPRMTPPDRAGR